LNESVTIASHLYQTKRYILCTKIAPELNKGQFEMENSKF